MKRPPTPTWFDVVITTQDGDWVVGLPDHLINVRWSSYEAALKPAQHYAIDRRVDVWLCRDKTTFERVQSFRLPSPPIAH